MANGDEMQKQVKAGSDAAKSVRRGRPTKTRTITIEADILSAARAMFLENGFSGTSMDNVAQMAGVSKSTLYARYADKGSLFEAVARERLQNWWDDVPDYRMPADMPISERLLRRGLVMLRMLEMSEIGAFDLLIAQEKARFPHLDAIFRTEGYNVLIALIVGDLKETAASGGWTLTDPEGLARAFVAALHGWQMGRTPSSPGSDDDRIAFVSRLTAIFLAGRAAW